MLDHPMVCLELRCAKAICLRVSQRVDVDFTDDTASLFNLDESVARLLELVCSSTVRRIENSFLERLDDLVSAFTPSLVLGRALRNLLGPLLFRGTDNRECFHSNPSPRL